MTTIQFPDVARARDLNDVITEETRALMGRYRVTQMDLAAWLGINQTAVSARLRGTTRWGVGDIQRIAEGFAVHPAELLGGYANGPRPGGGEGLPIKDRRRYAIRDSNPEPAGLVHSRLAARRHARMNPAPTIPAAA